MEEPLAGRDSSDGGLRRDEVEQRIIPLQLQAKRFLKRATIYSGVAFACILIGSILIVNRFLQGGAANKIFGLGQGIIGTAFIILASGSILTGWWYFSRNRRDEQTLTDLQFERDLLAFGVSPFVSRAEKLLSINQIQLRRYYELNLQQARGIFLVGLLCIAAGLGVVAVTFVLVKQFSNDAKSQYVVAAVGAVGTLLTNYVGSVFFRMYAEVGRSIADFHRQLAATHDMFFANLLASGIEGEERSKTLVRLALAIAERRNPIEKAPSESK